MVKKLLINCSRSYPIYIGSEILHTSLFKKALLKLNKNFVILTDTKLAQTIGLNFQTLLKKHKILSEIFTFPFGEQHKTRETKRTLEDILLSKNYGRDTCFIAVGGGVVLDLVGFLSATYCRGVPVIYIPTSLLAMADASIGGKTAVNTPFGKNLIGIIKQPNMVWMDTVFLKTLPLQEWKNGMVEIIKHSLISDKLLFLHLKNNINLYLNHPYHIKMLIKTLYKNCLIKKNIIEQDEKDTSIRQLLNFGHTIGHAIESIESYKISHGESVAIGVLVESYLSLQQKLLTLSEFNEIESLFNLLKIPLKTHAFQNKRTFKKLLMLDKKAQQKIPYFVLLKKIGIPLIKNNQYTFSVNEKVLDQTLDWASHYFKNRDLSC